MSVKASGSMGLVEMYNVFTAHVLLQVPPASDDVKPTISNSIVADIEAIFALSSMLEEVIKCGALLKLVLMLTLLYRCSAFDMTWTRFGASPQPASELYKILRHRHSRLGRILLSYVACWRTR